MARYNDNDFLTAIELTNPERGQLNKIADLVGCSANTASKRLRKLADNGKVEISKRKTYDKQEFLPGNWYFGGAGSCVRRYNTYKIAN
jgi:Mn-dependent DtxR family transcriptional regulator